MSSAPSEGSIRQPNSPVMQFLRFLVAGGLAALVNVVSRYLLNFVMVFEVAVVIAFFLGLTTGFLLMRSFVFGASQRFVGSEISRYAVVNGIALVVVWCTSVGLHRFLFPAIDFTWHADTVAHGIAVALPIISSYVGHRYWTFAKKPENPSMEDER